MAYCIKNECTVDPFFCALSFVFRTPRLTPVKSFTIKKQLPRGFGEGFHDGCGLAVLKGS